VNRLTYLFLSHPCSSSFLSLVFHSCHCHNSFPRPILILLTTFSPCVTYCHIITLRQTRNHFATDVDTYIASKTITFPDPCEKSRSTTLSKLGFGTRTHKFWVRFIPPLLITFQDLSSNPTYLLIIGHFLYGSVAPGPGKSRKLPLAALRKILVYDEEFGGPTLTVIGRVYST
jgi:hypothetical protein